MNDVSQQWEHSKWCENFASVNDIVDEKQNICA
ncbi:hypothetical protein LMG29542_07674 [Paraburkholderia humisilvae]|uniref:Uncharacterized protein n=1 Tax=Paraburkholderia humisilvae TaxID=627669 RepID=A0A6J5F605_9BURK|nr:hypothetical protein LMG29542_07674 [Paraburkholderia humisilvae]